MSDFWRAPGRSELFNTNLYDWKMDVGEDSTIKSIAVLKFINDNHNIRVSVYDYYFLNFFNDFKQDLDLDKKIELSKSTKRADRHFFRNLLFYNFINVTNQDKKGSIKDNDFLSITENGKKFLDYIKKEEFEKALDLYLKLLFEVKYWNKGTNLIEDLNLKPFLILFKLLSQNNLHKGCIPRKMITTEIIFINNKKDFDCCIKKLADDCYISSFEKISMSSLKDKYGYTEAHLNWNKWIISSLINLGILEEHGEFIVLSKHKKKFIQDYVDNLEYNDLFLGSD